MAQYLHSCYRSLGIKGKDDQRFAHLLDWQPECVVVVVLQRCVPLVPLPDEPAILQRDSHRAVGGMLIRADVAGQFTRRFGVGMAVSLFLLVLSLRLRIVL